MAKPVIDYFPVRGRAEATRLALAYKNIDWEETAVNYQDMKCNQDRYPFGQAPRFAAGDVSLVQSNAILRHIGRTHKMYGSSEKEHCEVDMVLDGVESLRVKYLALIYQDQLADEPKAKYWETHGVKANLDQRNGGAHLEYLTRFVRLNAAGLTVGSEVTIADCALFDLVDLHNRIFPTEMKDSYPELLAFMEKMESFEGIKKYRSSDRLLQKINGNSLG